MLFCTSLVAIAGSWKSSSAPTTLRIFNMKRKSIICELNFPSPILNVKMNRKRLVVVAIDKIYVYEITTLRKLNVIDTLENPRGVAALSSSSENNLFACPSQQNRGDLLVFDLLKMTPKCLLTAHKSPISMVSFSEDGCLVATASERGTIIRVFDISTMTCCYQFRRGCFAADITSIWFQSESGISCCFKYQ